MEKEDSLRRRRKFLPWELFTRTGAIVGLIVTILGVGGAVLHYLDTRIDSKLSDRDFLYRLGRASRPMLIFKGDETYVSNEGAAEYIKELKITSRASMGGITNLPFHIHVEFSNTFNLRLC